ncbi:single-stranded DNA-binding protein (plasmid) [Brevundimonas staleyi]|uniref:Single-stranded DNA-binding protein n=1 Tax=Brevundimonas staleyi TaxID=74326 RepID=A0ABW0FP16_9CAUL
MMNKAQLIGRLGADPETRTLNDGGKVTNLRVATSESWKDRDSGQRREKTEWHRVTVWGEGPAKYLAYAEKGSLVLIEGKIETRKYTDSAGVEKYATEIVVQSRGGQIKILADGVDRDHDSRGSDDDHAAGGANGGSGPRESYDLNDDIPF